jgi:hypothetical protein
LSRIYGVLLLVFFFLNFGLKYYCDQQKVSADKLQTSIQHYQNLQAENIKLMKNWFAYRKLITAHQSIAYPFYKFSSVVPEGLWLSEVSVNRNANSKLEFIITGYATDEHLINQMILEAENLNLYSKIFLENLLIENIHGSKIKAINADHYIFRFNIRINV